MKSSTSWVINNCEAAAQKPTSQFHLKVESQIFEPLMETKIGLKNYSHWKVKKMGA